MISSALHRRTFAVMTKSASQSMLQIKQRKRSVCSVAHRRGYKCVCACLFQSYLQSLYLAGPAGELYTHMLLFQSGRIIFTMLHVTLNFPSICAFQQLAMGPRAALPILKPPCGLPLALITKCLSKYFLFSDIKSNSKVTSINAIFLRVIGAPQGELEPC